MKAMIFAAGLGTRLRPLTNNKPKALVEVKGISLLELTIKKLLQNGFSEILINIHHFGEQVLQFLNEKNYFNSKIYISDERDLLLNTGGGLKRASWFFKDAPFLVHNVDILSSINLAAFYEKHLNSGAIASLAVRQRKTSRFLLFDSKNNLRGWRNINTGETKWCGQPTSIAEYAFSGIHVIDPTIFKLMPNTSVFSIIDVYLTIGSTGVIKAIPHDEDHWIDVGKKELLEQAENSLHLFQNSIADSTL